MSLRRRLIAAFTLLLLLAVIALSVVASEATTRVLLAQADEDLRAIESRLGDRLGVGSRAQTSDGIDRRFAMVVFDPDGSLAGTSSSGFTDAPDPLPAIGELQQLMDSPGSIATVESEDGSVRYRATAVPNAGGFAVVAVAIDDIGEATSDLVWWLVASGLVIAMVGVAAAWGIVRKGLQPVDNMIDTAAAIAAGDLARRIPGDNTSTELGRLGGALNEMLSRLDEAFERERTSQERLNQFVSDASHELRTPLAALQGYADLYRRGALKDADDLDAAMERIRRESGRMQRLVDDLLMLARFDRGQPLRLSPVDVAAVIKDAVADCHAIEPDQVVTYDGPKRLMVDGDENRLAQVFANLLTNARVHTPARTPVRITAAEESAMITIHVTDLGPGIAEGHIGNVFDRFYRGDKSQASQPGGVGLGLAIVAAILGAHDGTIDVANAAGGGASFTISLPTASFP